MTKVLIIDFFNLVKRYMYAVPFSEMGEGELINSLTINILNKISVTISETQPDLVYICSDSGYNKRAASINKDYKANRNRAKSLTDTEKENSYIEYLKNIMKILPFKFLEMTNTEADMLIQCLITYLTNITDDVMITVASSDSDMLQLLDTNVNIFDWYKGNININNWNVKHKKLDAGYFNHKNYVIAKSIIGDKSDNISGINGVGWKKIEKLFTIISRFYSKDLYIENINRLITILDYITIDCASDLDKKELKFMEKMKNELTDNVKLVNENQSIIDLSMYETAYLYKIKSLIERETFENEISFNNNKLTNMLKLNVNTLYTPEEYIRIISKLNKAAMLFYYVMKKSKNATENLRKLREKN